MKTVHKVFLGVAVSIPVVLILGVLALGAILTMVDPEGMKLAAENAEVAKLEKAEKRKAEELAKAARQSDDAVTKSNESDKFPEAQKKFHALNKACNPRYDSGINEIQKSLAFNQCNQERTQFARENKAESWVGKLTSIDTDQGADVVSIRIESDVEKMEIEYVSPSDFLSELSSNAVIRPGSNMFNKLSAMKEGDLVQFDAVFQADSKRGLAEISLTEKGSLRSPVFSMRFVDIRPYAPKVEAAKTSEAKSLNSSIETTSQTNTVVASNQSLSEIVGVYYLHGKTVLRKAGYYPDTGAGMPHTVDSDPADCGNAGCSVPWVNKERKYICVGIRVDDSQEESRWEIVSVQPGSCE